MSSTNNQLFNTFNQNNTYQPIPSDMVDSSDVARTARISTLPTTYSSQQLMPPSDTDSVEDGSNNNYNETGADNCSIGRNQTLTTGFLRRPVLATRSQWFTVIVLCFVNLINYMDRFTIAGILDDIQKDFEIGDDNAGLLQTAFVLSYMICAPIFGYLGDRYSRRLIMSIGVLLWSTTTLLGSFMHNFGWFITFRAMVGIGEASYSTIAPTIISDLFVHNLRSKMLAVFYFAIPVGSGLGYIVGSETANLAGNWRWALRVTPLLGIMAVILIMMIKDPERGESEGSHHMSNTTYAEDIRYLVKNRSFMLSTGGFTCVAFVAGALAWWGPKFMYLGFRMQPGNDTLTQNDVSYKFGLIALVSGIIGVPLGAWIAQKLRPTIEKIDPYICACGLMVSAPMVYAALAFARASVTFSLMFVFGAQLALNLGWSIVADILLYVVVPTRRATAEAFQILISHALGDAGSPYLVGVLSETIKKHLRLHKSSDLIENNGFESLSLTLASTINATTTTSHLDAVEDTDLSKFEALQYALFSTCFIEVLGGVFFLITAAFIIHDKQQASQAVLNAQQPNRSRINVDDIS